MKDLRKVIYNILLFITFFYIGFSVLIESLILGTNADLFLKIELLIYLMSTSLFMIMITIFFRNILIDTRYRE